MIIGIPKEIKNSEHRVSLTETNVARLVSEGHQVLVQRGAGNGSRIFDDQYGRSGAQIVETPAEVYSRSDMVVKVKEPLPEEYDFFREDLILFTFLHLAAEPELTEALCAKKVRAVAYETIEDDQRCLPLLKPMSEVAGRVGLLNGVYYLQKHTGGRGILAGGVPGVEGGHIVIIGGGAAGINSAEVAVGFKSRVTVLDVNLDRLEYIEQVFQGRVQTLFSDEKHLRESLERADLVVGAVLLMGQKAPKIITEDMIKIMNPKSVAVDISIDQGGCFETARPTSHENPVYEKHGVIHYCVPNIPSVVPRTSTYALTNATFPFVRQIARQGLEPALKSNPFLKRGLNVYKGFVTCAPVATALKKEHKPFEDLI